MIIPLWILRKDMQNRAKIYSFYNIHLIHQNYEILYDSIDSIAKNGDTDDSEKRLKKKTDIHTYFTAMQNIIKLLQNFPSSPLSKAKIKKLNQNDTADDEPDCLKEFFNN